MPQAGTQKFLKYDRLGIIIIKVNIFWEGHTNLNNVPISFDLMCLVNSKKSLEIFVTFLKYLNFNGL